MKAGKLRLDLEHWEFEMPVTNTMIAATLMLTAAINLTEDVHRESTTDQEVSFELSDDDKKWINLRLDRIAEKDQQFRTYLAFGTMDEAKLEQLEKLDAKEMLQAMANSKKELPEEISKVLIELQTRNDKENHEELLRLVEQFGYPSSERLGVDSDRLFGVLLHPPVDLDQIEKHTQDVCERFLPEVTSGRMPPHLYATFVDNMRGKILRRPQLYGTNQVYDRKTEKILPPVIENLETTNHARQEIGMAELAEGDYRLAPNTPVSKDTPVSK